MRSPTMTFGVAVFVIVTSGCGATPIVVVAWAWLLFGFESSGVFTVATLVTAWGLADNALPTMVIGVAEAPTASEPFIVQVSDCALLHCQPAPGLTDTNW